MKNYYKILELEKSASEDEIKRAYKKLALKNHPDKGGDIEKFREIQEAYEVLSNKNRREEYHNNNQIKKLPDTNYTFHVCLGDVYNGAKKTIKISTKYYCQNCLKTCDICKGAGNETMTMTIGPFIQHVHRTCGNCSGNGVIQNIKKTCENCGGNGHTIKENTIEIPIEQGMISDKFIKINSLGEQPKRDCDIPGDIIIHVKLQTTDNLFKRRTMDLYVTKQIKFTEAITGTIIGIQHYDETININTQKQFGIINPNKEYTIKEKGMISSTGKRGDLVIQFSLIYPEEQQYLSDSSKEILCPIFSKMNF
jgi:DnaJ homolog subfamily A member 2